MGKKLPVRKTKPVEAKAAPTPSPFPLLRKTDNKGQVVAGERRMGRWHTGQLRAQLYRAVTQLDYYADGGDVEAVELLAEITGAGIHMLRGLAERQPELLRPFARKCLAWPDFIGKHPGARKRNEWLLDELNVGEESPDRGGWRETSPATQQALFMRNWLLANQLALELPDLTPKTRKQWFEVGWCCLLTATNGKPEEDEFLAPIGQHRAKHSEHEGHQKRATERTAAANMRDGIKTRLASSFLSLTKFAPTSP